jgi:protein-L-isoaspartate(D-aspartate) O-methyltransferase
MIEQQLKGRGIRDPRVLAAFDAVPRHIFVPGSLRYQAYADHPLPIGDGQTISQPYIVALMAEKLQLRSDAKVLDVGTGSGYQAAILSRLCRFVYSVERVPALASRAKQLIDKLGYHNVSIKLGDGWEGWAEYAPYDAIVVAACANEVPLTLFDQLKDGGRLIVPIGPADGSQELTLFVRHASAPPQKISLGACSFVPFVKKN